MITLTYSRLRSLTQDGVTLNEVSQTGSAVLTGGVNTISERKKLYCTYEVEDVLEPELDEQMVLEGAKLYVSFAMFLPTLLAVEVSNSVPQAGFSLTVPSFYETEDISVGIEMPFYTMGGYTNNTAKNYRCWFYWITETTFAIELEYYNTFDENGYYSSSTKSNHWRFLSESWDQQNTNEVTESIYNSDIEKELRMISHIQREALTDDNFKYTETQEHVLYRGTIDKVDNVGEFLKETADEEIETLNSVHETPMVVRMYTEENNIGKFYAKLIKMQDDPDLDFIENYDLQEVNLVDGENPEDVAFIGPVVITRNDDDDYYQLEFSVNPEFLEDGYDYRVVIIGYYQGVDYSGAFNKIIISPPIPSVSTTSYCEPGCNLVEYGYPTDLVFTPTLSDCETEYTGNFLTCVIEERMRSKLIVDYSDDRWKNNLDCRKNGSVGNDVSFTNDIRVHLDSIEVEIYQEAFSSVFGGTMKHVHDYHKVVKTGANIYSSSSSNLVFTVDTVNELLSMSYDWRNRNEANVPNIMSYYNGAAFYPIDTQYWGGKSFFIKWRLNFIYKNVFRTTFTESLDIIQKMVVKDYDTTITVTNDYELDFVCPDETLCFDAAIALINPENYKLINIFELSPGQLYEEENWVPAILGQELSPYFNTQDADYTGGDAHFCLDPSTLNPNQSYNFSTLAKLT